MVGSGRIYQDFAADPIARSIVQLSEQRHAAAIDAVRAVAIGHILPCYEEPAVGHGGTRLHPLRTDRRRVHHELGADGIPRRIEHLGLDGKQAGIALGAPHTHAVIGPGHDEIAVGETRYRRFRLAACGRGIDEDLAAQRHRTQRGRRNRHHRRIVDRFDVECDRIGGRIGIDAAAVGPASVLYLEGKAGIAAAIGICSGGKDEKAGRDIGCGDDIAFHDRRAIQRQFSRTR